jgi:hypothetical protein
MMMLEQSSPKHDEPPLEKSPPSLPLQKQSNSKIQIILFPELERSPHPHPQFVAAKSLML